MLKMFSSTFYRQYENVGEHIRFKLWTLKKDTANLTRLVTDSKLRIKVIQDMNSDVQDTYHPRRMKDEMKHNLHREYENNVDK